MNQQNAIPDVLHQLAPNDLQILRKERYDGGDMGVLLRDFDPEDISRILQTYNTVKMVYDISLYAGTHQNQSDFGLFEKLLTKLNTPEFSSSVRTIGTYHI